MKKSMLCAAALGLLASGCTKKAEEGIVNKTFIMNVPAQVRVLGAGEAEAKELSEAILAEWNRISGEFSFSDPYSMTSLVNKKAYGEWVPVNAEFMRLLNLSLDYYRLSEGAFDITFAPLWPLWKEAASTKKMPAKDEIQRALKEIGSNAVQVDAAKKAVRFNRPVQINMGGILRGYCFERAYKMLAEKNPPYAVELRLGGNMLVYGNRKWEYGVGNPFNAKKSLGRFVFDKGAVMSSSGRDSFVEIEGKLYSHILDLRTGYPIENFSNLTVYFPNFDTDNSLASAVLAVMGKDKAFKLLGGMKGTAAVWVDGAGEPSFFLNDASAARWEEPKGLF